MEVTLYQYDHGACPYRETGKWVYQAFQIDHIDSEIYEQLLNAGYRRSGVSFYQNHCPNCAMCRSLRIDVNKFKASKSQRRTLNKNIDLRIERSKAQFNQNDFELYLKYSSSRHEEETIPTKENYIEFLVRSPVQTEITRYYLNDQLVGLGWIDLLNNSISSVYFAFNPDYSNRSLGVFSVLQEIELCRQLGKRWLHLGFWVEDSPKMAYKSNYRPCQILENSNWVDFDDFLNRKKSLDDLFEELEKL